MDNIFPIQSDKVNNARNPSRLTNTQEEKKPEGIKKGLNKDSFLKLLVAELRHQDPTQPMNDKEFISQMAQFSALEQMTEINKSIKALTASTLSGEAYSLLGKGVEAINPITGKRLKGIVSKIFYSNDGVKLKVNNSEIGLSDIHAIYSIEASTNMMNNKANMIKEYSKQANPSKDINTYNDTN
ncbi:MAG: flagellar hook capping FlgD N-terminal domain-containing protein [Spirochaetota bacterium]|nr:flagellar hook capping FlgD N-terminal domain-containing protein [Spirochaetota bacterium]